ncbi:MAG: LLM class flavin-dependent oxidoreductase [Actinomyces sp.]|nr:MAG: LLM class flavin-dependent oxidoreductase [Actinomyces sp.]
MTTPPAPLARGSVSLRLYVHDLDPVSRLEVLRRQARHAEAVGYEGFMVSEHHADFPGYLPDPVLTTAVVLAATSSAWVAPCPLLVPTRPVATIVEQLAWLDAAWPQRVGAGFAAGALPVDFELVGVPFDEANARFTEALPRLVAALHGRDHSPLGRDRAVARLADHPLPVVVAAQSATAARRAARLGTGVLFDSLQTPTSARALAEAYRAAGGTGPVVAIRRVWIGEPPRHAIEAQMAHYRSYAPPAAQRRWQGDQLVCEATPAATAEHLAAVVAESGCDTVNVRIHAAELDPADIEAQLELHADGFVDAVRRRLTGVAP